MLGTLSDCGIVYFSVAAAQEGTGAVVAVGLVAAILLMWM
jgi:hypothetical protein